MGDALVMLALLAICGCTSSGQMIAEGTIEDRIALLRVGESTKSDVERILEPDRSTDTVIVGRTIFRHGLRGRRAQIRTGARHSALQRRRRADQYPRGGFNVFQRQRRD